MEFITNSIRSLLFIAVLCSIWPAHYANVCCFPKQLEGKMNILYPITSDTGMFTEVTMDISFDMIGKRIREYIPATGYLQLMFYGKGVVYIIHNSTCQVHKFPPLPDSMFCVPDKAKRIGNYRLGIKDNINVTDYVFVPGPSTQKVAQQIRRVSNLCVPVADIYFRKGTNFVDMITYTYRNLTPGIKDEKVFDLPSFCKSVSPKVEDTYWKENNLFWNAFDTKETM